MEDKMGMDRKIKRKKWPPKKIATYAVAGIFIIVVLYVLLFKMSKSTLNVRAERLTISTVERGPFQEYIPVIGTVIPITQHFLTADEGGRVEEIYVVAGTMVDKGDELLKLANTNLIIDIMWRESELFRASDNLRSTRLSMEQYRLRLKQELADIESRLQQQRRVYERYQELVKDDLISQHEYEIAKDQYDYLVELKKLTIESQESDLKFRQAQIDALEDSLARLESNLTILKQKQENLVIKAPISGHLTRLEAEIGESKNPGQEIGQIDVLEGFKYRAGIDEHYIARIELGRTGEYEFAGQTGKLLVKQIYPEVRDNRFEVDMEFVGKEPEGIRRGLTLHVKLELGDIAESLLLPRGGFEQTTGGNWVYVLDEAENIATKRRIKVNRYNPDFYEVLEGLEPGERVITSSYESFGNMERLVLK
jgi:HlyD family secretion protein